VSITAERDTPAPAAQREPDWQHARQTTPAMQAAGQLLTTRQRLRVFIRHLLRWIRHRSRDLLGFLLAHLWPARAYADSLSAAGIGTVLVCRINGRMGNTLFLTPLIRRLHELLPQASIDLALAYPKAAQLLAHMPGVRRIIVIPYKSARLWRYLAALRRLRACHYDLAIDPTPESSSGRAALSLCRARYRLGFATRSQWASLTHAVALPPEPLHQAVHPVYLLTHILGAAYDAQSVRLWLPLQAEEVEAGRRMIAAVIGCDVSQTTRLAVGFFAHAATNKLIPQSWWQSFWEAFLALEPEAVPVEFLPSPTQAPTIAGFHHLHVPQLRALTSAIAATRLFVTTDSGPMHLASSTSVPTVGLFSTTDPLLYRPLKPSDMALSLAESSPQLIARRCQLLWHLEREGAGSSAPAPAPAPARQFQSDGEIR
jgi:ADP-heptose:LPS heptosyltransferase